MLTRTDRRRFPILLAVIAALAMAMLFSPVQAQEGSAPDKPRGLEATATHDSVTLTWDDPGDDSITGYVILRRVRVNNTGGDFSVLVSDTGTAALTYTDDTVAASLTYTYRIKAINEHGVSERSRWFHVDTPAAPEPEEEQAAEPPDKPTGLEATATHDSVTLTWDDPQDDSITGYVILRRIPGVDPQGHFNELVSDTGTDATTYTDDTVSAKTRYTYRIKAINEHGVSERSRWSHISTSRVPRPVSRGHLPLESVSEGSTDLPNDDSSPGVVAVGDSVVGMLGTDDDRDRYKVELLKGVRYQIDMEGLVTGRGTLGNPKMNLHMPDGSTSTSRSGAVSISARFVLTWEFDEPGWIEAYRGPGNTDRTGTYTLSVIVLGGGNSEGRGSEERLDYSDDTGTRGRLDVGAAATGLVSRNDKDWFRVELIEGRDYFFHLEAHGSLADPKLWGIFDNAGDEIDGHRGDATSVVRVAFTASYTGRHFVSAGRKGQDPGSGAIGVRPYTISVRYQDIPAAADTTATVRPDGVGSTGIIDPCSDIDWVAVELEGARSYRVDLEGADTDHGDLKDPIIVGIYDASSTLVPGTEDNDSGEGLNALVVFRSLDPGTYYVSVGCLRGDHSRPGKDYTLTVRPYVSALKVSSSAPDLPADTSTSGVVEVNGSAVRGDIYEPVKETVTWTTIDAEGNEVEHEQIVYDFDTDWFAVELEAGRTYRIDMKGAILTSPGLGIPGTYTDPELTLNLPQINSIHDRLGGQLVNLWGHDESPAHHLFRVTFHAHRTETHYIAVSGEGRNWGGYELRVKDVTQDD